MSHLLAKLAVRRASLQQTISEAASCGDRAWADEHRAHLENLDNRIKILKKVLRPEVVADAREITNAPI